MLSSFCEYLTTKQFAQRVGLKPNTVALLCRNGTIKAKKPGRDWLIGADQVEAAARRPRPGTLIRRAGVSVAGVHDCEFQMQGSQYNNY
jgi:excisionase family DNA binding protein